MSRALPGMMEAKSRVSLRGSACQPCLLTTLASPLVSPLVSPIVTRSTHFSPSFFERARCALLMPSTARSGAIRPPADNATAEPLDAPEADDESIEAGEEKLRSG